MKKVLAKILILFFIFAAGVTATALLLNSQSTDDRSDLNEATLPEVMIDMNGTLVNRMYGYAQPMQADFTRDSVTPLDTSKTLSFVINPYDAEVSSFSYEIRTSDGSKVLENKKIKNLETDEPENESGIFHADFSGDRRKNCLLLYQNRFQITDQCVRICFLCGIFCAGIHG